MARAHPDLPKRIPPYIISKSSLLDTLARVDRDENARQRVLAMENDFRTRISQHVESLPLEDAQFKKSNTNPFVLLFHCLKKGYRHIREIEEDILPAKLFSSMETSAGRMVEKVVLPVYSWTVVPSEMHTPYSVIDGRQQTNEHFRLATLKSGPRCLNDPMTENIADAIITNCNTWATEAGVSHIDFTYGVLYGTRKKSNKKDWHILRNIADKASAKGLDLLVHPRNRWSCQFRKDDLTVDVTIRIGVDLWTYVAGHDKAFMELCVALIRACVAPSDTAAEDYSFTIADLGSIISLASVPDTFNVGILQRSQLEWLFFVARHFCDELSDGAGPQ